MRGRVVKALRPLDAVGVENPVYPGTPDVNYIEGWVELKWLRQWPINPETPVLIEHYTQVQRIWIYRRYLAGGNVFLLLQVQKTWLLFDGWVAYKFVGKVNRKLLYELSTHIWEDGLSDHGLVEVLRNYENKYHEPREAQDLAPSQRLESSTHGQTLSGIPSAILPMGERIGHHQPAKGQTR